MKCFFIIFSILLSLNGLSQTLVKKTDKNPLPIKFEIIEHNKMTYRVSFQIFLKDKLSNVENIYLQFSNGNEILLNVEIKTTLSDDKKSLAGFFDVSKDKLFENNVLLKVFAPINVNGVYISGVYSFVISSYLEKPELKP